MVWTGLQLWMELGSHEPRMILYLNDFYQAVIRQGACNNHAGIGNLLTEFVVELIAMTMTLADHLRAIGSIGIGILTNLARICTKTHGAALILYINLGSHQVNNRMGGVRIELGAMGIAHAAYVAGELNNSTLHAKAQAQEWNLVLTGILDGLDLALNATVTKAARYQNTLAASKFLIQIQGWILQLLGIYPMNLYRSIIVDACMMKSLGNGDIGIRQLHILAYYSNLYLFLRILDLVNHLCPLVHVYRAVVHAQLLQDDAVQALVLHHERNLIDGIGSQVLNNSLFLNVTEQGQLLLHILGQGLFSTAYQDIRLDTDTAKLLYAVLGRLGLQLTGSRNIRHQGNMDVEHIVPAYFLLHLADSLHKWQGLDITYSTTDFGNNHIGTITSSYIIDTLLDFIGNMRNNLYSLAQIIATALLVENIPVYLAGGDIGALGQVDVDETLIVAQIQIGFCTIIGNKNLAVLIWAHGAWVNIDIWIKLLNSNLDTTILQQTSQGSSSNALAQRRNYTAGNENILCHVYLLPNSLIYQIKINYLPECPQRAFPHADVRSWPCCWMQHGNHGRNALPLVDSTQSGPICHHRHNGSGCPY